MNREYIGFGASHDAWRLLGRGLGLLFGIAAGGLLFCLQLWFDAAVPEFHRHLVAGVGAFVFGLHAVMAGGCWMYAERVRSGLEAERPDHQSALRIGARYEVMNHWWKLATLGTLTFGLLVMLTPVLVGLLGLG